MGNFFRKLMYGCYGYDQLNLFLLILCLICWLLSSFLKNVTVSSIFSVLGYALIFFSLFRSFSRNYDRRRSENSRFLSITSPITRLFRQSAPRPVTGITNISAVPPAGSCCGSPRARGRSPSPAATAAPPSRRKLESNLLFQRAAGPFRGVFSFCRRDFPEIAVVGH